MKVDSTVSGEITNFSVFNRRISQFESYRPVMIRHATKAEERRQEEAGNMRNVG